MLSESKNLVDVAGLGDTLSPGDHRADEIFAMPEAGEGDAAKMEEDQQQ